jgi:hypothetical protein
MIGERGFALRIFAIDQGIHNADLDVSDDLYTNLYSGFGESLV